MSATLLHFPRKSRRLSDRACDKLREAKTAELVNEQINRDFIRGFFAEAEAQRIWDDAVRAFMGEMGLAMGANAEFLTALFREMETKPIWEIMRGDETKAGWQVIIPGTVDWYSLSDWRATDVLSMRGDEVRLVAITANKPGTGAFRRLVDALTARGLTPVIVCPFYDMEVILKRWNWRRKVIGRGVNLQETWRPRKAVA